MKKVLLKDTSEYTAVQHIMVDMIFPNINWRGHSMQLLIGCLIALILLKYGLHIEVPKLLYIKSLFFSQVHVSSVSLVRIAREHLFQQLMQKIVVLVQMKACPIQMDMIALLNNVLVRKKVHNSLCIQ